MSQQHGKLDLCGDNECGDLCGHFFDVQSLEQKCKVCMDYEEVERYWENHFFDEGCECSICVEHNKRFTEFQKHKSNCQEFQEKQRMLLAKATSSTIKDQVLVKETDCVNKNIE